MANNYLLLPLENGCVDYGCSVQTVCLPAREDCDGTPVDSLLTECNLRWNCVLCETDDEYFIPYKRGEKIQFQTLLADLVSSNRNNPTETDWLTVELYNQNGLLSDDMSVFLSRWLFGWNGTNNYQIFEVDTSTFSSSCWYIKIVTEDGRELCSQEFKELGSCPEETVLIRGIHEDFDCNGFYYGDPVNATGQGAPFVYDNTIRIHSGLQPIPGTISKDKFGQKIVGATIREQWRLVLTKPIPPFLERLLLKTYLSAQVTRITPEVGPRKDLEILQSSPRDRIDYSNMMLFNVDLFIECSEAIKRC